LIRKTFGWLRGPALCILEKDGNRSPVMKLWKDMNIEGETCNAYNITTGKFFFVQPDSPLKSHISWSEHLGLLNELLTRHEEQSQNHTH